MDFDNLTRKELAVIKVACDNSLLYFTRFWFKVLRGSKFILNHHHDTICHELEQVANYKYELLNINIPPRFSKTELAGVNFIAWGISKNATANFLYITASDELRSETSTRIRDIVTHPLFTRLYGINIKKSQSGKNLWRTEEGGGLKTATIFGQITGFGAGQMVDNKDLLNYIRNFEGAIVLDDINKIDDAISDSANNRKANDVILTTILSRKNSQDTPIINMQQRAGVEDATSTLLEFYENNPKVKSLVMPVIYEGKPLWEFKNDSDSIERLRTHHKTRHVFETQYMQKPTTAEGLMFARNEMNYFKITDKIKSDSRWMIIDPADKGTDNYSAAIGYICNNLIYVVDVIYDKRTFKYTEPKTKQKGDFHKVDKIILETNKEGTLYKKNLQAHFNNIRVRGIHNTQNKILRIKNQVAFIEKYFVFRDDYEFDSEYYKFMQDVFKLLADGSSKHDDSPDVLAIFAKQLRRDLPNLFV